MPAHPGPDLPLLARAPGAVLFRRPHGGVTMGNTTTGNTTTGGFLAAATRLAATLAATAPGPVLNLCADRAQIAIGLAGALLAGRVSLFTGDRSPSWLTALAERHPGLTALTDTDHDATLASLDLPSLTLPPVPDTTTSAAPIPTIPADRLAAIVFTSGSTGEPVGHRKSWGELVARSVDAARRFRLIAAQPASVVGTVPGQHMYGLETTILLPLHAPAASWCGPAFYPVDIAAALAVCPAPRVLVTTPLQLRALLAAEVALPPVARVISATAPLDPAVAAAAEARWQTEIWEIFGATEVGSIASRRTTAGPDWRTYPRVRLTPHETANRTANQVPSQPGLFVLVHAPGAAPFPLNDRIDLADPTSFRLIGRHGDLVKLGGRRASLAGLTSILNDIDGVEDGIFLAPEDSETRPTARMLAFAVAPGLSAERILAELRARIDPVFLPRRVVRIPRLPRDRLGKLPARALAELRAQAGGQEPA